MSAVRAHGQKGYSVSLGGKGVGSYKTVPATRQRLNITRILRIVRERGANLVHTEVDAAVEVHERVVPPETVPNFFPGYDLPGPFCQ
jgi:hypothetical protein